MRRQANLTVMLVVCMLGWGTREAAADSNGVPYVPSCKPPDGFELRSCSLVEVTPEAAFRSVWKRQGPKKALDIVNIEKLRTQGKMKDCNSVEEYWRRGKDRIELRLFACPDEEKLSKFVDFVLRTCGVREPEMATPVVGEKAWMSTSKDGMSVISCEGLNVVSLCVTMGSADAEEVRGVAETIAREALRGPCEQNLTLNKRMEAYIEKVKKRQSFGEWKGKTETRGKKVNRLDIDGEFLSKFSKNTRIDTPKNASEGSMSARVVEALSGAEVEIEIDLADDAGAAHEKMVGLLALNGRPSYYIKCAPDDPNEEVKVGDICFKFFPPWTRGTKGDRIFHKIFFC